MERYVGMRALQLGHSIDDRIADSHSYLCKYEDRSHIQTHLTPDYGESGEDPVEENVTRQLLYVSVSAVIIYVLPISRYESASYELVSTSGQQP
eukprot:scaffold1353_cov169-Chaetoceros_neogracile.AAC.3